ncbi:MAG: T9SS type A sorting domain-containing protein [Candidatus Eisenbacteria bacterium]|nr:T9SS type A sorting domain-containing protein [Candidatus Eisenbacteria bacterium]
MRRISALAVGSALLALVVASPGLPTVAAAHEESQGAMAAIDDAASRGEISGEQAILYKLYLVKGSTKLPLQYGAAGSVPLKCATEVTTEARVRLEGFSPGIREEILALLARPVLNAFEDTAHFRVHYSTTGANVPYNWPNRAYLDAVKTSAETSWTFYHTTNAWQIPPSDGTSGGGTNLIDLYIDDLGTSVYGVTYSEAPVAGGYPNDWTAYFVIDDDYEGFGYTDRTLPMKVTVAHEYHHVVQMGYVIGLGWWMENMSTFMEDEIYDTIDDNYNYLSLHTTFPFNKMTTANNGYEYGSFIWPTFLKENWDHSLVREIETCAADGNLFTCFDTVLADRGSSWAAAQAEYNVWNFYMSAARNDGQHYIEGGSYPVTPSFDKNYQTYPQLGQHPTSSPERRPEATGYSIQRFRPPSSGATDLLSVLFDGPACTEQVVFIAKQVGSNTFHEYYMNLDANGNGALNVPDFTLAETEFVHMIVSMPRDCGNGRFDYVFNATAITQSVGIEDGDPLYTRTVVLEPNSPNPFGPTTRLSYETRSEGPVRLTIYDAGGRAVRSLLNDRQAAGAYSVRWDGRDDAGRSLSPGVYFARIEVQGAVAERKMLMIE